MTFDLDRVSKGVDIALKAEVHAFMMLLGGILLALKGQKDMAELVIGAALSVFKGNR